MGPRVPFAPACTSSAHFYLVRTIVSTGCAPRATRHSPRPSACLLTAGRTPNAPRPLLHFIVEWASLKHSPCWKWIPRRLFPARWQVESAQLLLVAGISPQLANEVQSNGRNGPLSPTRRRDRVRQIPSSFEAARRLRPEDARHLLALGGDTRERTLLRWLDIAPPPFPSSSAPAALAAGPPLPFPPFGARPNLGLAASPAT